MKNKYDVIIIGSGVGGLICGNYLACSGKKVLILEKNPFTGGCCSSFINNGFFFDTGAHLVNEVSPRGSFAQILRELASYKYDDFIRLDPFAVIFIGNERYQVDSEADVFSRNLKSIFPREKNIDDFFTLLERNVFYLHYKFKNVLFQDLLDQYFDDLKLKAILYALVFPLGTLPDKISAVYVLKFLESTLFFGGFYPKGGMQHISDELAKNFRRQGGTVILGKEVEKIISKEGKACGVLSADGDYFYSDTIVSNISPNNTLGKIDKKIKLTGIAKRRINDHDFSESAFIVHIAFKNEIKWLSQKTSYFFIDLDAYKKNKKLYIAKSNNYHPFGFLYMPNSIFQQNAYAKKISGNIMTFIFYKPESFWQKNKDRIAYDMIYRMGRVIPNLRNNILFTKITTPDKIELYTGNDEGAVGGWAMNPKQEGFNRFPYEGSLKNLFFCGHWTYPGVGISSAAVSGKNAAKLILSSK